ncbi:MAG: hypothetical protein SFZ23_06585 [Planctomycetota bacterium]|nr:hypothetical protein [Planctomycetota bacterium]
MSRMHENHHEDPNPGPGEASPIDLGPPGRVPLVKPPSINGAFMNAHATNHEPEHSAADDALVRALDALASAERSEPDANFERRLAAHTDAACATFKVAPGANPLGQVARATHAGSSPAREPRRHAHSRSWATPLRLAAGVAICFAIGAAIIAASGDRGRDRLARNHAPPVNPPSFSPPSSETKTPLPPGPSASPLESEFVWVEPDFELTSSIAARLGELDEQAARLESTLMESLELEDATQG